MSIEWRILSIGALDAHDLREERAPVRTGHATTTLIRSGDVVCVVDPGLPGQILGARLEERAGITPADITHVFLTSFRPDVRRGIDIFEQIFGLFDCRQVGQLQCDLSAASFQAGIADPGLTQRNTRVIDQRCNALPHDFFELHFKQQMRTALQVQTKVHLVARQPTRITVERGPAEEVRQRK